MVLWGYPCNLSDCSAAPPSAKRSPKMTITEVLQKATEGGYRLNGSDRMDTDEAGPHSACSAWTQNDNDSTCVADVKEP